MSDQKATQQTPAASAKRQPACTSCGKKIDGQFVRALGGFYHLNCFKCKDCGVVVAQKFFPLENSETGQTFPLCEHDYFKRLDLICHKCQNAIRGSFVSALDRKYHLEHFGCEFGESVEDGQKSSQQSCDAVFGPDDAYYEHKNRVYCHYHYSTHMASKCGGCGQAILKQFVEVKSNTHEQWHPECYMIYKSWNIKLQSSADRAAAAAEVPKTQPELRLLQQHTEEKVNRIWTVLSAFEESAASCISDMLLHVSNQEYVMAVEEAGRFIVHVEVLFRGIDGIERGLGRFNDTIGLSYNREPKMLAKKIVNFFSLLSHTQDYVAGQGSLSGGSRSGSKSSAIMEYGTVTQELLALVTSLAQYLKSLIRIGLSGAIKLERVHKVGTAVGEFLNCLVEIATPDLTDPNILKVEQRLKLSDVDVKSDLCIVCRRSVEEACIRFEHSLRWHSACFRCHSTREDLTKSLDRARFDPAEARIYSVENAVTGCKTGFQYVTTLEQYTFLLKVALKRLYGLLHVKDDSAMETAQPTMNQTGSTSRPLSHENSRTSSIEHLEAFAMDEDDDDIVETSSDVVEAASEAVVAAGRDANTEETADDDVVPLAKTVMNAEQYKSRHNLIEEFTDSTDLNAASSSSATSQPIKITAQPKKENSSKTVSSSLPEHNMTRASRVVEVDTAWPIMSPSSPSEGIHHVRKIGSFHENPEDSAAQKRRVGFLSELSALEMFAVKHLAVVRMLPLVEEYYSFTELLDMVGGKKMTFWNKLLATLNPIKKTQKPKEGSFGVPLETVVDKFGIETKFGSGAGRLRIPMFIEQAIVVMRRSDLGVEGIFRKNGNIKNLNVLEAKIAANPRHDLSNESSVQLAALLKKFLREMPEPLLTFKLHRLFIVCTKLKTLEARKKMLHYTICLLPKPNRDLLEVFMSFLRHVASFSEQNKMDISNLATVVAPNILYGKKKESRNSAQMVVREESFLAIDVVRMLLEYQSDVFRVPTDIAEVLAANEFLENKANVDDLSSQDVIKLISSKRPSRDVHVSGGANLSHPKGTAATIVGE